MAQSVCDVNEGLRIARVIEHCKVVDFSRTILE